MPPLASYTTLFACLGGTRSYQATRTLQGRCLVRHVIPSLALLNCTCNQIYREGKGVRQNSLQSKGSCLLHGVEADSRCAFCFHITVPGYCLEGAFEACQFHAARPFKRGDYQDVFASSAFGNLPRDSRAGCGRLRPLPRYQTSSGE